MIHSFSERSEAKCLNLLKNIFIAVLSYRGASKGHSKICYNDLFKNGKITKSDWKVKDFSPHESYNEIPKRHA